MAALATSVTPEPDLLLPWNCPVVRPDGGLSQSHSTVQKPFQKSIVLRLKRLFCERKQTPRIYASSWKQCKSVEALEKGSRTPEQEVVSSNLAGRTTHPHELSVTCTSGQRRDSGVDPLPTPQSSDDFDSQLTSSWRANPSKISLRRSTNGVATASALPASYRNRIAEERGSGVAYP